VPKHSSHLSLFQLTLNAKNCDFKQDRKAKLNFVCKNFKILNHPQGEPDKCHSNRTITSPSWSSIDIIHISHTYRNNRIYVPSDYVLDFRKNNISYLDIGIIEHVFRYSII